jgi:hypothetical protein
LKLFHISDILSVTTGLLVSSRHMEGIYDILNFLTGDNLFTHQLPRAMDECKPWLRTQFPELMSDHPVMIGLLAALRMDMKERGQTTEVIVAWVNRVREGMGLPEMIPLYEMGADMHTHIDPIEEAEAMFGKDRVIPVEYD